MGNQTRKNWTIALAVVVVIVIAVGVGLLISSQLPESSSPAFRSDDPANAFRSSGGSDGITLPLAALPWDASRIEGRPRTRGVLSPVLDLAQLPNWTTQQKFDRITQLGMAEAPLPTWQGAQTPVNPDSAAIINRATIPTAARVDRKRTIKVAPAGVPDWGMAANHIESSEGQWASVPWNVQRDRQQNFSDVMTALPRWHDKKEINEDILHASLPGWGSEDDRDRHISNLTPASNPRFGDSQAMQYGKSLVEIEPAGLPFWASQGSAPLTANALLPIATLTIPSPPLHYFAPPHRADFRIPSPSTEDLVLSDPVQYVANLKLGDPDILAWLIRWRRDAKEGRGFSDQKSRELQVLLDGTQLTCLDLYKIGNIMRYIDGDEHGVIWWEAAIGRAETMFARLPPENASVTATLQALQLMTPTFWSRGSFESESVIYSILRSYERPGTDAFARITFVYIEAQVMRARRGPKFRARSYIGGITYAYE